MKRKSMFVVVSEMCLLSWLLSGCSGTPVSPTIPPDASPADVPVLTDCSAACDNLKRLGCPEGDDTDCERVCTKTQASLLTDLHPSCLASAGSKEAARSCGSVRCP